MSTGQVEVDTHKYLPLSQQPPLTCAVIHKVGGCETRTHFMDVKLFIFNYVIEPKGIPSRPRPTFPYPTYVKNLFLGGEELLTKCETPQKIKKKSW